MSIRVTQFAINSFDRAGNTFRYVARQPSWITRAALIAFLVVVGIPIVLLFLFALLVGVVVFTLLAAVNWLTAGLRRMLPRDDGRRNVTVVRRNDSAP